MKAKKSRQLAVRLEHDVTDALRLLSAQWNLSMSDLVRRCVEDQLRDETLRRKLSQKRRVSQLCVRFDDNLTRELNTVSRHADQPLAEVVRLCVVQYLEKVRRDGGIKLNFDGQQNRR